MVCKKMSKILKDKNSPILELVDKKKIASIVESGGSEYKVPWFGQLMAGPQMIAYLIQLNNWLLRYDIKLI